MRSFPLLGLLALGVMMACAPQGGSPAADPAGPLLPSLQASAAGGAVEFVLQVTNVTESPVPLEFASGQSFDFAVQAGGREVWRWSADQMFTQALRSEVLPPGETRAYTARWDPPRGQAGEFTVVGSLTARNHDVQQATRFRLP